MATPRFELRRAPIPGDVNIDDHAFELVGAAVYLCNKFLFLMCVVYIPPNTIESEYMILCKIIEKYCDNFREVIVVGDFNLYSGSVSVCNYYDFFQNYCGFDQSNQNGRCLDFVLSTFADGEEVVVREAPAPLVPVDAHHPPLEVSVRRRAPRVASTSASASAPSAAAAAAALRGTAVEF